MYDNITPEQWIYGLLASLIAFAVLWRLFYHYTRPRDEAPAPMSSADSAPAGAANTEPIHVSIPNTAASISTPVSAPADHAGADTDAANSDTWELPRVSRHISDGELIVLLAALRGKDGKHRFSANQIARLVGGSHNATMERVKEIRSSAPAVVFRPLAPEQQQLREQLQLDQR